MHLVLSDTHPMQIFSREGAKTLRKQDDYELFLLAPLREPFGT
jgi:hypothetical protein